METSNENSRFPGGGQILIRIPKDGHVIRRGVLGGVLAEIAIKLNLNIVERSGEGFYYFLRDFLKSFGSVSITDALWFSLLCVFFSCCAGIAKQEGYSRRHVVCSRILAAFFAFFMPFGYSFRTIGTYQCVTENILQVTKSVFCFCGYYVLFYYGIVLLYHFLDRSDVFKRKETKRSRFRVIQWYVTCLERRPFLTALFTLLAVYLPILIIDYPGRMMGDTGPMLRMFWNPEKYTKSYPILYVTVLGAVVKFGYDVFQSWNVGFFLFILLQAACIMVTFAYSVKRMIQFNISRGIVASVLLYYLLSPVVHDYMDLANKDSIFCAAIVLYLVQMYALLSKQYSRMDIALLVVSLLGIIALRKDGAVMVILLLFVFPFFTKKYREKMVAAGCAAITFFTLLSVVFPKVITITPSRILTYSGIALQQTARYVRDRPDDVSDEEREAINAVLKYEKIAKAYNPTVLDPITRIKQKNITAEKVAAYYRTWFEMFLKHPGIYFQAAMHYKNEFFYPTTKRAGNHSIAWNEKCMTLINSYEEFPFYFAYPESVHWLSKRTNDLWNAVFQKIPVLSVLTTASTYVWALFIWLFYCISIRNKRAVSLLLPLLALLFIVVVIGPRGGTYTRYLYSLITCAPLFVVLGLAIIRQEKSPAAQALFEEKSEEQK